jgi:hypothetical protein
MCGHPRGQSPEGTGGMSSAAIRGVLDTSSAGFTACRKTDGGRHRGYITSYSPQAKTVRLLAYFQSDRICANGKPTIILHLGDFDPSGQSIFDSVAEDVAAFVEQDRPWATVSVRFERIALTADQVRAHDLPTAPPKATDTRSKTWEGGTCQLEALAPNTIAQILREAIARHIDFDRLEQDQAQEEIDARNIAGALPAPGRSA